MKRRRLNTWSRFAATSLVLALTSGCFQMTALAEGEIEKHYGINDEINAESGKRYYFSNSEVTINGDIEADDNLSGMAAILQISSSDITVNGEIRDHADTFGSAVGIYGESTLTSESIISDNGIALNVVTNNTDVQINVDGDIIGSEGIILSPTTVNNQTNQTSIDVTGDVIGTTGNGLLANYSVMDVSVNGDITGATNGVILFGNNNPGNGGFNGDFNITAKNVTGGDAGILLRGTESAKVEIVIDGVIEGTSHGINYTSSSKGDDDYKGHDITVWKVTSDDSGNEISAYADDYEKIVPTIHYIIRINDKTTLDGDENISAIEGASQHRGYDYTANEGQTVVIRVADGYEARNNGEVLTFENGSYVLTVPRGGGVNLTAVLKKIEENDSGTDVEDSVDSEDLIIPPAEMTEEKANDPEILVIPEETADAASGDTETPVVSEEPQMTAQDDHPAQEASASTVSVSDEPVVLNDAEVLPDIEDEPVVLGVRRSARTADTTAILPMLFFLLSAICMVLGRVKQRG